MASFISTSTAPSTTLICTSTNSQCHIRQIKIMPSIQISRPETKISKLSRGYKNKISCSIAQPETLEVVQSTIAKQLSIDESTVTPQTKFADLGADSLDTVEIMMALEEKFGVSIGEEGAQNIATVQDAADLIQKVKEVEN
uniref:Acyl carrier protein n=1 Tax=Solanum lycopersicum TaxID=4081 RepID=A0A3Q7EXL2_SOLLC